ncbi:LysR family transcriptional regulator [Exiguobacterium artemiae]|uniref:LysR family transcriptional regulator n=1 Tax=Exiguobacterium artemiae TaxID=340145 RepID=UPI002964251B|nr:LysR family transcriptional regulator [Exiguobacterium sibiricum]MDW2886461.1 LysR family transcriptional regulator [Exiguobacterium sibiricum]
MKILEDELGARLLIQSNLEVKLTEEGTTLYKYAKDILKLVQDAKSAINKKKWREYLAIDTTQTVSAAMLPKIFLLFMEENDDIGMSMKTQDKQRLQEMLFYGEIDSVFVNGLFDEERFESVHSFSEDIVILSHQDFKFVEDGCPTLFVNRDTTCTYRTKTFEVEKDNGYTDLRIMEFDTIESICML